jgi:hypothetical protein
MSIPYDRLAQIMRQHSLELEQRLGGIPVQLSVPVDGKGIRIKVSVPPGYRSQVPRFVTFTLEGESYVIPLEVEEDYQEYRLQGIGNHPRV